MKLGRSLFITLMLVLAPMLFLCIGNAVAEDTLDWGKENEVTDPEDYYIDHTGNPIGYLDKNIVTAEYDDKLYVLWETTERKKGGSMIFVSSMRDESWGGIRTVAGSEDGIIDTQPAVAVFDNGLYLAWQAAQGDDTEIMCKVLELGDWTSCGEISGPDDYGLDTKPYLAVHKGRLWATWVTRSSVTGKDPGGGDIVARSFNGQDWSDEIHVVSPTPANGMDDQPRLISYNDKLVVAWQTRDDDISTGTDYDIVLREYDGAGWGDIQEVTAPDGDQDDDTEVKMAVYNGLLYFVWQSGGDRPFETDIHVASFDGKKVSTERNIVPEDNLAADEHPTLTVFEDKLYVAWNSNDADFTIGADDDIAMAYLDGDGWTGPEEVTNDDMAGGGHGHSVAAQDKFPVMTSYGDGLYVLWEQDDQRASVMDSGDIKYKRHPPEERIVDKVLVVLGLLIVLVMLIGFLFGVLGRRKVGREKRHADRKERDQRRKKAISKAGGRRKKGRKRKR